MSCDAVLFCNVDSVMGFALHAADGPVVEVGDPRASMFTA